MKALRFDKLIEMKAMPSPLGRLYFASSERICARTQAAYYSPFLAAAS
jgi:hypothetical protein